MESKEHIAFFLVLNLFSVSFIATYKCHILSFPNDVFKHRMVQMTIPIE